MLKTNWPSFSFEFMPPRSADEATRLFETIRTLEKLAPAFVCVTCRAANLDQTVELVGKIRRETDFEPMAHLVCHGVTRNQIAIALDHLKAHGIENVLALRGDIADPGPHADAVRDDLAHGSDLTAFIAERPGFCIGTACYPEGHVEAPSLAADIGYAKLKVDAGASFLITQLFFDNRAYFRYVRAARAAGITVPILPGIFPITNAKQLRAVRAMGASVPPRLESEVLARADDPQAVAQFGVAWATLQCSSLLAGGAPGIHFYTFNRSPATRAILGALRSAKPWEWRTEIEVA